MIQISSKPISTANPDVFGQLAFDWELVLLQNW